MVDTRDRTRRSLAAMIRVAANESAVFVLTDGYHQHRAQAARSSWGGANTDFGEKQNARRLEFMARIYF